MQKEEILQEINDCKRKVAKLNEQPNTRGVEDRVIDLEQRILYLKSLLNKAE